MNDRDYLLFLLCFLIPINCLKYLTFIIKMAENNPKSYVDLLKNLPPESNIDPKLMISIITSLLTRVDSLEIVLTERTQQKIDLKNHVFDLEKRVNFQERYSSKDRLTFPLFDITQTPPTSFRYVQPTFTLTLVPM